MQPRIVAGIPAYNEGRFIGEVVRKARELVDEVIVVDDGSTDSTARVAEAAGALVIRHKTRKGAGGATKSCFKAAKAKGADVLVTLDGDAQHQPSEISKLVAPLLRNKVDLAIGSRFLGEQGNMRLYRRFGIKIITFLYNFGSKVKVSDAQSCFRAYGQRALHSLSVTEAGFGFSVELLVQARQRGLTIGEVPISCVYHSESHSSSPVIHGLGVAFTVLKLRLGCLLRQLVGRR